MKGKQSLTNKVFFYFIDLDPDPHSSNFVDPNSINPDPHPWLKQSFVKQGDFGPLDPDPDCDISESWIRIAIFLFFGSGS